MDILMVSGTPVTLADVGQLVADNNEFKFAVQNVALKRMIREMQATSEAKEIEETGESPDEEDEAPD